MISISGKQAINEIKNLFNVTLTATINQFPKNDLMAEIWIEKAKQEAAKNFSKAFWKSMNASNRKLFLNSEENLFRFLMDQEMIEANKEESNEQSEPVTPVQEETKAIEVASENSAPSEPIEQAA